MKNDFQEYKLSEELCSIQEEVSILREEYHKIGDKLAPLAERERNVHEEFFTNLLNSVDDKLSVIMNPHTYGIGGTFYSAVNEYMWDTYHSSFNGYNTFTMQREPQLKFIRNSPVNHAQMRKMITDILPYMIPHSKGMTDLYGDSMVSDETVSFCMFDILEEGLSEAFVIKVFISHDLKIRISKTRYSRVTWSDVMEFDAGIDFLIKNYYYIDSDE